jgi:hypothetical protein
VPDPFDAPVRVQDEIEMHALGRGRVSVGKGWYEGSRSPGAKYS